MHVRFAVGRAELPVRLPVALTGFAAREGLAHEVLDPLQARVLCVRVGRNRPLVWVSLEVLTLEDGWTARLRQRVARACGTTPTHVLLGAVHTHSGPAVWHLPGCGEVPGGFPQAVANTVVRLAKSVASRMRPGHARYTDAPSQAPIYYRRQRNAAGLISLSPPSSGAEDPDAQPVDRRLRLLVLEESGGPHSAWVVGFACHSVVLGSDNLKVSGDYPGRLCRLLEASDPGRTAMFFQGACGDVNPEVASRGEGALEEFAGGLADELERLGARATPLTGTGSAAAGTAIDMLIEPHVPVDQIEQYILSRTVPQRGAFLKPAAADEILQMLRHRIAGGSYDRERLTLVGHRLGGLQIAGLPFEAFGVLGRGIERRAGKPCWVMGYVGGSGGYLAPAREVVRGGYETAQSHLFYGRPGPYRRDQAGAVVEAASRLLAGRR